MKILERIYKTRWNPDAPSQPAGFNGTLIRATSTDTTLLDATSGANLPVADYGFECNC